MDGGADEAEHWQLHMAHFLLLNDCRAMAWVYVGYAVRLGYSVRSSLSLRPFLPLLTHSSQIGLRASLAFLHC
jgi:hypothetical protein